MPQRLACTWTRHCTSVCFDSWSDAAKNHYTSMWLVISPFACRSLCGCTSTGVHGEASQQVCAVSKRPHRYALDDGLLSLFSVSSSPLFFMMAFSTIPLALQCPTGSPFRTPLKSLHAATTSFNYGFCTHREARSSLWQAGELLADLGVELDAGEHSSCRSRFEAIVTTSHIGVCL